MAHMDYLKFLVEEIHSTTVATIGSDGHPQTRIIDMMYYDADGVYFLTAKGKAFYEQLMEQIKSDIIQSELKEGEALPSVRTLAGELRISALTVKKAYDKLEEEGFVTTVHGKGTYVTASDKQLASEARRIAVEEDFDKAIDRAVAIGMEKEEILEVVKLILDEK